jgi:glycosyltransferase involved in cell wall biosynthesis
MWNTMNSPQITVIVPVYNGEEYLHETLNSLLGQSFTNFELLVVDDGSTDASADVVCSIKDDRLRLIRKENSGLCHTLNRAIDEARAPFIARNDQDDVSFPQRLQRQFEVMTSHPSAIALFSYNTKFGGKHWWANSDKLTPKPGEVVEYDPIKDGCLLGSTMFARTESLKSIQGFRQPYYPCDDWDLECRLARLGSVLVLREPLVAYRFHANANTYRVFAEMQDKIRWTKDSHQRSLQGLPELDFQQFLAMQPRSFVSRLNRHRKDLARLHMRVAGQNYLDGHYLGTAVHLATGAVLNPRDIFERVMRLMGRSDRLIRTENALPVDR